jgi:hypothetical protein
MSDPDYSPGTWTVIVGARTWLLADVRPTDPIVARCWGLIRGGADVETVLGAIADEGLRAVRSFAAVQHEPGACRVIVRGAARVGLTDPSGEVRELGAEGVATWLDRTVDGPVAELRLTADAAPEPLRMPLATGVALASSLTIPVMPQVGSHRSDARPRTVEPLANEPERRPGEPTTPQLTVQEVRIDDEPEPQGTGIAGSAVAVPAQRSGATEPVADARFDHLFGPTMMGPPARPPVASEVGSATLLPPLDDVTPSIAAGADAGPQSPSQQPPSPQPLNQRPPNQRPPNQQAGSPWRVDESGIIQAISFSDQAAPPPAPVPVRPPVVEEIPQEALATRLRSSSPAVPAVRCTAGHLNPPGAAPCRACGATVPEQEPVMVARPVLGVLRLATGGEPISLDRAVILGRAPDPEAGTGAGRANAIKVDSPGRDVSRSHAEFRADGWQLVVTDLGSANGTTVAQPSAPPFRLERNGSAAVEPGAVVTLADEVSFRYEVRP